MALGHLRLLFHIEHLHIIVHHNHARALELLNARLLVAHNARCSLFLCKVHKLLEREEQQVVCGNYQKVVIQVEFIHREQQVTDRPKAGFIGEGVVVHHRDGLGIVLLVGPELEDIRKPAVGDNDVLINLRDAVNIVQHTPQNGVVSNLQQGLGEVLGEFP